MILIDRWLDRHPEDAFHGTDDFSTQALLKWKTRFLRSWKGASVLSNPPLSEVLRTSWYSWKRSSPLRVWWGTNSLLLFDTYRPFCLNRFCRYLKIRSIYTYTHTHTYYISTGCSPTHVFFFFLLNLHSKATEVVVYGDLYLNVVFRINSAKKWANKMLFLFFLHSYLWYHKYLLRVSPMPSLYKKKINVRRKF